MTASMAVEASKATGNHCGANLGKRAGKCTLTKGWGTSHPGFGRCKVHGGASPSHVKAAAREQALALMRSDVVEMDVSPDEALLYAVRRGAVLASFARAQLALCEPGSEAWIAAAERERKSLDDAARWSKMALDARVGERQVRYAERQGAVLAGAFENALQGEDFPAEQRARMLARYVASLLRLEAADGDVIEQ